MIIFKVSSKKRKRIYLYTHILTQTHINRQTDRRTGRQAGKQALIHMFIYIPVCNSSYCALYTSSKTHYLFGTQIYTRYLGLENIKPSKNANLLSSDNFFCKENKVSSNKETSTYLCTHIHIQTLKHPNRKRDRETDTDRQALTMFICNPVNNSRYNAPYVLICHYDECHYLKRIFHVPCSFGLVLVSYSFGHFEDPLYLLSLSTFLEEISKHHNLRKKPPF